MADTIITRLSQIGTIKVRPTSAVRKYATADSDAIRAAQELKVDAVLDGTLQRSGDRLRVSVNLLRVSDGTSLWAESFSVSFSGIFEVQDEVSREVASRLQGRLTATERDKLARRSTSNPEAYLAYAKAMYYFGNRATKPGKDPATENTIELLQQAVNLDPKFALAHAQLGYAYAWSAVFLEENSSWITRAKRELDIASKLDSTLAQVHVARSFIVWSQYEGFQAEAAIRELRLAQQIDPSAGLSELAGLYLHVGLEEETRRLRQRALDLDPNSEMLKRDVVIEYYLTARPDEGLAADKRLLNNGPGAHYYREKRMFRELRPLVEKAYSANPEIPWDTGSPAHLLAFEGKHQEAQAALPGIMAKVRRNRSYHHAAFDAARIYALGGNAPEAVKWLQVAVDTGFPNYPLFARDTVLDAIRKDPGFVAFMAREKKEWERRSREFR